MGMLVRLAAACLLPLMLASCFVVPGKFASTLRIGADRSFAFAYKGEVIAIDLDDSMSKALESDDDASDGDADATENDAALIPAALQDKDDKAAKKAATEARNREIATALAKEAGYRSVEYKGDGVFAVDYAIEGRLTHNFVYPFNSDATAIFPFIAIELRKDSTVRMTAPAFARQNREGMPGGTDASQRLDGSFTLETDAEIVSQNSEAGATGPATARIVAWRATPLTKTAPMAVLRLR